MEITYKDNNVENMFLHIYKSNDEGQRQPNQPPVHSGYVTEVPCENAEEKVKFLK